MNIKWSPAAVDGLQLDLGRTRDVELYVRLEKQSGRYEELASSGDPKQKFDQWIRGIGRYRP